MYDSMFRRPQVTRIYGPLHETCNKHPCGLHRCLHHPPRPNVGLQEQQRGILPRLLFILGCLDNGDDPGWTIADHDELYGGIPGDVRERLIDHSDYMLALHHKE